MSKVVTWRTNKGDAGVCGHRATGDWMPPSRGAARMQLLWSLAATWQVHYVFL